jgi:hypothetical protein
LGLGVVEDLGEGLELGREDGLCGGDGDGDGFGVCLSLPIGSCGMIWAVAPA